MDWFEQEQIERTLEDVDVRRQTKKSLLNIE